MFIFQKLTQIPAECGLFLYISIGPSHAAIIIYLHIYLPTETMNSFPSEKNQISLLL